MAISSQHTTRYCKTLVIVAVTILASASYAQEAAFPTFEVATIRPSDPKKPRLPAFKVVPGRFEASNMTLKGLIAMAYDKTSNTDQQVSGGPAWIRFQQFDVVATIGESTLAALNKLPAEERAEQNRKMIQELLADRFKVNVHRETKELITYTLRLGRDGPKLKRGVTDPKLPTNIPQERIDQMGRGFLKGHNSTMDLLAKTLGSQPDTGGRTVIDNTGLTGHYDFTLKWMPAAEPTVLSGAETGDNLPQLFTALQEQLGLRMVSAKSSVAVIVVDNAFQPSEN